MMKCIRPLAHNPQFEGKHKCKACMREAIEEYRQGLITSNQHYMR